MAFLGRAKGDEHYVPMMEFLQRSKIHFDLTHYPTVVYESMITQFWETAHVRSVKGEPTEIVATIDEEVCVVTESLVRAELQLDDENSEYEAPKEEILQGLHAIGYEGNEKVWHKNKFCPKWRFLVHTLLQCISSKSGGWDQFSTSIAFAIVCLSQGRTYNFSKYIFDAMVKNVKDTKLKYLMYPRFLQIVLGKHTNDPIHMPINKLTRNYLLLCNQNILGYTGLCCLPCCLVAMQLLMRAMLLVDKNMLIPMH